MWTAPTPMLMATGHIQKFSTRKYPEFHRFWGISIARRCDLTQLVDKICELHKQWVLELVQWDHEMMAQTASLKLKSWELACLHTKPPNFSWFGTITRQNLVVLHNHNPAHHKEGPFCPTISLNIFGHTRSCKTLLISKTVIIVMTSYDAI